MENFPGNPNNRNAPASKPEKPEKTEKTERVVEKVVVGEVVQKKKPFTKKFKEVFLGSDAKAASGYIVGEVLLPALRNMIVDATSRGIERLVFGEERAPRRSAYPGAPRVQYNRPADRYSPQHRAYLPGQSQYVQPRRQDIADIILASHEDAERVIEQMTNIVEAYDVVSVADLYQLVGIPHTYVDNNWGWSSLTYVNIQQTRQGWLLVMPPIEPI